MLLKMSADSLEYIALYFTTYNSLWQPCYCCRISYFITVNLHIHNQIQILAERWVYFLPHHVLSSPSLSQIMVAGALSWQLISCMSAYICQAGCCSKLLDYTSTGALPHAFTMEKFSTFIILTFNLLLYICVWPKPFFRESILTEDPAKKQWTVFWHQQNALPFSLFLFLKKRIWCVALGLQNIYNTY